MSRTHIALASPLGPLNDVPIHSNQNTDSLSTCWCDRPELKIERFAFGLLISRVVNSVAVKIRKAARKSECPGLRVRGSTMYSVQL